MKRVISLLVLAVAMCITANAQVTNSAPKISWKMPSYTIVARQMSLREAFQTFGTAQGISVIMSKAVGGAFSGEFRNMPADEFLDRVTTLHNLVWYYDGAMLFIYGSGEVQSMLFSLKYMKAAEVRRMLQELNIEDKRFPIRTASDDELIMVYGPPRYVQLILETIERADSLRERRTFNQIETRIFPLRHTWAEDVTMRVTGPETSLPIKGVASMLKDIMEMGNDERVKDLDVEKAYADKKAAEKAEAEKRGEKPEANDKEGRPGEIKPFKPVIKAENRLNAILVRDVVTRLPAYERLIKQLDKPQRLVEIAVTKIDLTLNDALDWQLSLAVSASHDDMSGQVGQNATMGRGANSGMVAKELVGKGLAGAMTYIGDSITVNGSLEALRQKGKARNISRMSLLTINNLAAKVTDKQSYHARVVGTEVASLETVTAGTSLEIKPRIVKSATTNDPDRVWLSLQLNDGGFKAVEVDSMPMTSESSVETQAIVPVGESLLLAGYTRDIKEEGGWGIPYLRDIPYIGWLFGGKSWLNENVQRFFILTPYILEIGEPDIVSTQAERIRNFTSAFELSHESDIDNASRREEEAKREESRVIYEETMQDIYERNEKERQFEREKRKDKRNDDKREWQDDLIMRRDEYREQRKIMLEKKKSEESK